MPGIFVGATPVTGMGPVKEVYVGATKVWPTGPYTSYYGTKVARVFVNPAGTIDYQSDPAMTHVGNAVGSQLGTCGLDLGANMPIYGGIGSATLTGALANRTSLVPSSDPTTGTQILGLNSYNRTGRANYYQTVKAIVPAENGDSHEESYLRCNNNGSIQWAVEDGWTVQRTGTGTYLCTAPKPFFIAVWASICDAQATSNYAGQATVSEVNVSARTFVVKTWLGSLQLDYGFAVGVVWQ
jgi:hypothetical protein